MINFTKLELALSLFKLSLKYFKIILSILLNFF